MLMNVEHGVTFPVQAAAALATIAAQILGLLYEPATA